MTKISGIVILTLGSGATIFAAQPHSREPGFASSSVATYAVSGRVSLLAPNAGDVANAVVYLEPLPSPRPTPPPVAVPVATAPTPPRDTVRVLWDAVRDLRDAVRSIRLGQRPAEPRPLPNEVARDTAVVAPAPSIPAPPPPPRAIPSATIAMRDKTFEPHVRVVETGGQVEYPNRDPFSHNVFSTTPGGAFDLGLYPRGESRGVVFRRAGSYAIYCNIHSKMSAFVVSVPSPHHARPDASGRFAMADVPAGRYRVHVWHERAPEQTTTITVGDRAITDVALTLDARTFQQASHLNKFGQPYRAPVRSTY